MIDLTSTDRSGILYPLHVELDTELNFSKSLNFEFTEVTEFSKGNVKYSIRVLYLTIYQISS